jgi:hypothetical protein
MMNVFDSRCVSEEVIRRSGGKKLKVAVGKNCGRNFKKWS